MTVPARFAAVRRDEPCYGVDVADDGALVVAKRMDGQAAAPTRFPAGAAGVAVLREHIASGPERRRVCIGSSSAAALAIAMGLAPLPRVEVMLVRTRAIGADSRSASASPEERAQRLARLAARWV
jgi:hypothetical protein